MQTYKKYRPTQLSDCMHPS